MRSITPKEIADKIKKEFDRTKSQKISKTICSILCSVGYSEIEAFEWAEQNKSKVLNQLQNYEPTTLPFEFSQSNQEMLIGKSRRLKGDKPETLDARMVSPFLKDMQFALSKLHHSDFETLCAATLKLAGATEMFALRTMDEGGIDFFGRIPLRNPSANIPFTLLRTQLFTNPLLIIGQSKCNDLSIKIGTPEIVKFAGQVKNCLAQYTGNPDPPRNRVPKEYYIQDEPCLPIFITTASFSERAPGTATGNGILLIDGLKLSEFLLANKVGIKERKEDFSFAEEILSQWVKDQKEQTTYKPKT